MKVCVLYIEKIGQSALLLRLTKLSNQNNITLKKNEASNVICVISNE